MTLSYKEILVETWDEFEGLITGRQYSNWAYRGQADAQWALVSTLSRYLQGYLPRSQWERQEIRILRIFKRKAHHFLSNLPEKDDDFRWLALMQHHGAPTRLIDFTWSPYVAAFFALERSLDEAAIWAINPRYMQFITERFSDYKSSRNMSIIWIGEPFEMNKRLIAQSGTFVLSKSLDKSIDQIVIERRRAKEMLVKFILPRNKVRDEGMKALYSMNITHATLFPDLDGLARSMAYELEFSWI